MNLIQTMLSFFKLENLQTIRKESNKPSFTKETIISFLKRSIFFVPTALLFFVLIILTAPVLEMDNNEPVPFFLYVVIYLCLYICFIIPLNLIIMICRIVASYSTKKNISNNNDTVVSSELIIENNKTNDITENLETKNALVKEIPVFIDIQETTNENVPQTNNSIENNYTHYIRNVEKEAYFSPRIIIPGVHIHFISVARDILNRDTVDELRIKRSYNINSSDYELILQQLIDAKILDSNLNILMTSDTLEHFLDIYQPNLFHCTHCIFDKDIFICLGEILIEKGIDYAKKCFSSIDELLDYLEIFEKLNIVSFHNDYEITCTTSEFQAICKGIPEYYNTSKIINHGQNNLFDINYDTLDGSTFERFCAELLLMNSYESIKITPTSADHGIDILAEKDGVTYAIQCKCYSSAVGNNAIQEAFTGKQLYRKDIAVVLTNNYFTTQAQTEAEILGVKLWDRDKLVELINRTQTSLDKN